MVWTRLKPADRASYVFDDKDEYGGYVEEWLLQSYGKVFVEN
jgi:hypothetical protein